MASAGPVHDTAPPPNWPPEITYINKLRYAYPSLKSSKLPPSPTPKCKLVKIQLITSPTHPAFGQRGLFVACTKIPPRTHILDYLGEVHSDDRPESDYDLSLGDGVGVDAQQMGNEARFINDYRGTSVERCNAEFKEREVDGELRMSVWSGSKEIRKGEEILVSYGKSWWKARAEPESELGGQEAMEESLTVA